MFPTIFGKILKGVGKVIGIAGAAAAVIGTGGALAGALPAVAAGTGLLGKIFKGASKVSKAAVNLATGTTKEERDQVKSVKTEAKAAQDKLDQVERLIAAGATRAQAEKMAGITAVELGSADAEEKDKQKAQEEWNKLYGGKVIQTGVTEAEKGCFVTSILLLSGLAAAAAGLTAILIFT
jgi:alanyl-tRNA synthetase